MHNTTGSYTGSMFCPKCGLPYYSIIDGSGRELPSCKCDESNLELLSDGLAKASEQVEELQLKIDELTKELALYKKYAHEMNEINQTFDDWVDGYVEDRSERNEGHPGNPHEYGDI